ncbi:MAG: 30S ribosomal protein S30 [Bacteroidetes bacterium]|jgi:ribosomal subunit interface protein|nr:30S ribosomal protein S30 [Bacteroidota bacterium]
MADLSFDIEYHSDTPELTDDLKDKTEQRLAKLTKRHKDVTGASIGIQTASGDTHPRAYRARVVLYLRPDNVASIRKEESVAQALGDALDAVERQVREQRDKLRETWKRP